jgi:hypothetical protein
MRSFVSAALVSSLAAASASAQGLRATVADLFKFGECGEALCLQVNAALHGLHYSPSATATSASLIGFFSDAIGNAVSNLPISAASGGVTFSFAGGAPVKTSISPGPIFAERSQTLGRGRLLAGGNVTQLNFRTFRGLPLDQFVFNFAHQNVGSPVYGDPEFENDVIQVRTKLDLNVVVTTAFLTYGLLDRVDVGVALPFVRTSLSGTSLGQIIPFGPNSPHFFGTDANRQLTATASTSGSSIGLGDVAARVKINLIQNPDDGFAVFGDVRLATGSQEDLRGSGNTSARVLGVYSGRYGNFSPHVNAGGLIRTGDLQNNAILATVGFDHLLNPNWTMAVDALSEIQLGDNKVAIPPDVEFEVPFRRSVTPTNIPGTKDHVVNGSLGFKYAKPGAVTGVINALFPLRAGSLQPRVAFTAGLEYSF